jgi:hypothetical protein
LEKCFYQNKLISQLDINGNVTTDEDIITEELTSFYNKLYSDNLNPQNNSYTEPCKIFTNIHNNPKLSKTQKDYCDNKINEHEILTSLKKLHNGKTPGTNGLSPDFYKFF